jgi:hypothetical protein
MAVAVAVDADADADADANANGNGGPYEVLEATMQGVAALKRLSIGAMAQWSWEAARLAAIRHEAARTLDSIERHSALHVRCLALLRIVFPHLATALHTQGSTHEYVARISALLCSYYTALLAERLDVPASSARVYSAIQLHRTAAFLRDLRAAILA